MKLNVGDLFYTRNLDCINVVTNVGEKYYTFLVFDLFANGRKNDMYCRNQKW